MAIENLLTIVVGILSIVVPIYIFFKGNNRVASQIYGLIGFFAGPCWSVSLALFRESTNLSSAIFWDRLIYVNAIFIAPLFFLFSRRFPKNKKTSNWLLLFLLASTIFFIYELYFTDRFVSEILLNDFGNTITVGITYKIWLLWFVGLMGGGVAMMFWEFFKMKGVARDQVKYIIIGATLPAIGTLPTNAILPLFGIYKYIWMGPFFLIAMSAVVAYGITRTRFFSFFEIVKLISKPLLYFLLAIFGYLLLTRYYSIRISTDSLVLGVSVAVIASVITLLADWWLEGRVFPVLSSKARDLIETRDWFVEKTSMEVEIGTLSNYLVKAISSVLYVKDVNVVILNGDRSEIIQNTMIGSLEFSRDDLMDVLYYWEKKKNMSEIMILAEQELLLAQRLKSVVEKSFIDVLRFMRKYKFQVIIPMNGKDGLLGLCLLGNKQADDTFNVEDIDLLRSLAGAASISFSRAILYKEVRDFNSTLEQKIDEATVQLKQKVDELSNLRQREQDTVDIMGHELRTPLTIIKNSINLIDVYKAQKQQTWDEGLEIQYRNLKNALIREISLVETLLAATKIDSDKLSLEKDKVDLKEIIEASLLAFKPMTQEKKLSINKQFNDSEDWFVYADKTRTHEVIDNIISNAVKFTNKGSIEIELSRKDDSICCRITDTGVGMSKEDLDNLGKKFYRAQQYIGTTSEDGKVPVVRPGGTGLGMYVTFGLVKAMNGKIKVESKLNKGTQFNVCLPAFTGDADQPVNKRSNSVNMFEKIGLKK